MSEETKLEKMKRIFHVMDDISRLKILHVLFKECGCTCSHECSSCVCLDCKIERSVSEIVELTGLEQSLVSHQLKVLKDTALVSSRREGPKVFYSLADGHVRSIIETVTEHVLEEKQ